MKKWFSNLRYKLYEFMQGRYGFDEFSRFLAITGIFLMFISYFQYLRFMYIFGFVLLVWSWLRILSTNIYKRQMELNKYVNIKNEFEQRFNLYKSMWRDSKTHKYYKCPNCKAYVRITKPVKGKRIRITCPKCGQKFEKRI